MKRVSDIQIRLKQIFESLRINPQEFLDEVLELRQEIIRLNSITPQGDAVILVDMESLHVLGFIYEILLQFDNVHRIAAELQAKAEIHSSFLYKGIAQLLKAKVALATGDYALAKKLYDIVLPIFIQKHHFLYVQACYIDMSRIQYYYAQYEQCLEYLFLAEKEHQMHPQSERVGIIILSHIITTYSRMGHVDKVLEYAHKNLQLAQHIQSSRDTATALFQVANALTKTHDYAEAIRYMTEAMELARQYSFTSFHAKFLVGLAEIYTVQSMYDKSLPLLLEALEEFQRTQNNQAIATVYLHLAIILSHKKETCKESKDYFEKACTLGDSLGMKHFLSVAFHDYADALYRFEEYEQAFLKQKEAHILQQELRNEESLQKLRDLEVRYDLQLKEKENEVLRLTNKTLSQERTSLQLQLTMKTNSMLEQLRAVTLLRNNILESIETLDKAELILKNVKNTLRNNPLLRPDWDTYMQMVMEIHPNFVKDLLIKYPGLTKQEVRVCVLLRSNLTTPEIAELLNVSDRTVENTRLRIRKKIMITEGETIQSVLNRL